MTTLYQPSERAVERATNYSFWIVFGIALYTPFEEFFLRWLPGIIPVALRFVPEFILYWLLFVVCCSRLMRGYPLRKTPIDWLIGAFFLATIISMVLNSSPVIGSIINLRTIWRYLSVFYIVVNMDISPKELKLMLNGLKIVMLAQGLIGSIQYFLPAGFNQAFFAPREFEIGDYQGESMAATGDLKVGATAGTFSDSAVLSAFLLVGLSLFLSSAYAVGGSLIPNGFDVSGMGALLFGIFASKKRAALAIALITPLMVFYVYNKRKTLANVTWLYGGIALLAVIMLAVAGVAVESFSGADDRQKSIDLGAYFLQVFSPEYWQQSNEQARGWFMQVILNGLFNTQSWFGFGPDFAVTQESLRETLSSASEMAKLERDAGVFDDSFWFAFIAYFGIVGTVIYGFILKRLYDAARWLIRSSAEPELRTLGATFATLVFVTVLYTFVERIFRLRAFSFYFWLLAGLVINMCHMKMALIKAARQPHATAIGDSRKLLQ
ncbi:MAG: putative nucleoside-diphosphate sugar epimerase [Phormidesmis priestleyi Ana]|uniref:Putative nucleoside-diphosphate sugar epimerase n=1 Tax=Phormidesmis priestleyi Ana TaxID=1666911 RepID=A0A0P7ZUW1_9CYAN|nr:MAG: putative nucleoside-diphosphate sugar epimerase [Phormidesmis priestleyi Ana]